MPRRSLVFKLLLEAIGDGQWWDYDEVVRTVSKRVPPNVALHHYYAYNKRRIGLQDAVRRGSVNIVKFTIRNNRERFEVVDRQVRYLPPQGKPPGWGREFSRIGTEARRRKAGERRAAQGNPPD